MAEGANRLDTSVAAGAPSNNANATQNNSSGYLLTKSMAQDAHSSKLTDSLIGISPPGTTSKKASVYAKQNEPTSSFKSRGSILQRSDDLRDTFRSRSRGSKDHSMTQYKSSEAETQGRVKPPSPNHAPSHYGLTRSMLEQHEVYEAID